MYKNQKFLEVLKNWLFIFGFLRDLLFLQSKPLFVICSERLGIDPNTTNADETYKLWFRTFNNFLELLSHKSSTQTVNKFNLLINYIEPNLYEFISECETYDQANETLKTIYVKPKNVMLARYILSTRKQKAGESLDQLLNELKALAKGCDFKTVSDEKYKSEMIRDAFINGLRSNHIRQRLLENKTLDLQTAFDQARSLDVAQQSSTMFSQPCIPEVIAPIPRAELEKCSINDTSLAAVNSKGKQNTQSCWFCGNSRHPCNKCPAKDAACHKCKKIGHY